MIKIGALSDIHGDDISKIAEDFEDEDLSAVLVNGDICNSSVKKLEKILKPLSALSVPVLVRTGNMDSSSTYTEAMTKVMKNYHNIIDMERKNQFDINGVKVILSEMLEEDFKLSHQSAIIDFLGGTYTPTLGPMIVQAHEPPYGYGDVTDKEIFYMCKRMLKVGSSDSETYDPDNWLLTLGFNHVGKKELTEKIHKYKPTAIVFGHIHENNEIAPPALEIGTGIPVKPGETVKSLALNTGPAQDGCYAILTVDDGKVSYQLGNGSSYFW